MLARIAHELYWIGRQLSRAEHTARMLDGIFHADLQGRPDTPAGVRLSWDALLAIMGAEPATEPATRDEVVRLLTLDPTYPASVLALRDRGARGRAHARATCSPPRCGRRSTRSTSACCGATSRAALRTGPYSVYAYVKERCGLFWGVTSRTMLRDEARAFLEAGAAIEAGDMVLRMLRVALPTEQRRTAPTSTCATARRSRCCRPSAACRPTGARCPRRRTRGPVARFLLYERDYPDSVASSVEALHDALTAADSNYRNSPPVLRLGRLVADLDFRSRAEDGDGCCPTRSAVVQRELAQVDADIAQRYFGGTAPPVAQTDHAA